MTLTIKINNSRTEVVLLLLLLLPTTLETAGGEGKGQRGGGESGLRMRQCVVGAMMTSLDSFSSSPSPPGA